MSHRGDIITTLLLLLIGSGGVRGHDNLLEVGGYAMLGWQARQGKGLSLSPTWPLGVADDTSQQRHIHIPPCLPWPFGPPRATNTTGWVMVSGGSFHPGQAGGLSIIKAAASAMRAHGDRFLYLFPCACFVLRAGGRSVNFFPPWLESFKGRQCLEGGFRA